MGKYEKNRRSPMPLGSLMIRIAAVLFCLVMFSTYLMGGLFARYTTSDQGGDSARVAKFDVACSVAQATDEDGKDIEGKFTLTVTNNSEVAVAYSIHVAFSAPMSITIGGETKTLAEGETSVTFTNDDWTLAPGEDDKHTLQFAITDWTGVTNKDTDSGPTEPVTFVFEVSVTAEQID